MRHKQIPEEERSARKDEIWAELFARKPPCLRASLLPKKFDWGIHYKGEGKIALYAKESPEYERLASGTDGGLTLLNAMRSKRK